MCGQSKTVTDPVCGMKVHPARADARAEHAGTGYYFCSQHCADRFTAEPSRFISGDSVH